MSAWRIVANVPRLLLADDDDGTLTVWRSPLVKHTDDIYQPVAEWLRAAPYERVSETERNDPALWFGCVETVYRRVPIAGPESHSAGLG